MRYDDLKKVEKGVRQLFHDDLLPNLSGKGTRMGKGVVEYYFSNENLQTDKFLMNYVTKDKDGFVPVAVIASFRKMKKLTQDRLLIVAALRQSSVLVVSSSGKKLHALVEYETIEAAEKESCECEISVLVANADLKECPLKSVWGAPVSYVRIGMEIGAKLVQNMNTHNSSSNSEIWSQSSQILFRVCLDI